jgi:hypothetical protein
VKKKKEKKKKKKKSTELCKKEFGSSRLNVVKLFIITIFVVGK